MAKFSHLFLFFATLFLVPSVLATDYVVGDRSGWAIGVDYFSWTTGKTFFVGDNLVFKYKKGLHNVFDVNVTAFSECATPSNQLPLETGNDVVRLTRPGTKWFICNIAHHCQSGQKLIISVQNRLASSPPPTSLPSPTPAVEQVAPQPSSLPPTPIPSLPPPPPPAASSPSVPSPNPQSPAPTPSESIPPSHSPGPSATAPTPSGAAAKSAVTSHLGFLVVAIGVLAGVM